MPFATYHLFQQMTDAAFSGGYAFPAVNVHDLFTLNAVIEGFAAAESDGIVQIYPDAAAAVSGQLKDKVLGAVTLAEHAHRIADRYNIAVAVHSDHCPPELTEEFLLPLIRETEQRRNNGRPNLFTGHMFDGSMLPLKENLDLSKQYLQRCRQNELWLEIEVGIIGAESDGAGPAAGGKVFTSGEDFLQIKNAFSGIAQDGFLVAPAFGNIHGVYKPGEVSLRPAVLQNCQNVLVAEHGEDARFKLVFHGGSGSSDEEIRQAAVYGVVKMNIDTDGQYVFTRAVADYMFKNYDKILRIDGEVGVKMAYFTETWLDVGRLRLADFVSGMCRVLGSAGKTICR
jgi:fructose-bisphosphate aldolase, class II